MTKTNLIKHILDNSRIHHNISTLGMKLPPAPDNAPDNIFWDTCNMLVSDFCDNWLYEPRNNSGNRNLCACRKDKPQNILAINGHGVCKVHDLWHCYTTGRMGATLYWDKYWKESQGSYHGFKYDLTELEEMKMSELLEINEDINAFNQAIRGLMKSLPVEPSYRCEEWEAEDKVAKRRQAMGYNKTLWELLEDKNPAIVRLAKGIKKELNK